MTSAELKHRAKLQEWSARIQDCRSSGLPVRAWCRQERINATTYYRWEREFLALAETEPCSSVSAVRFAELSAPKQVSRNVAERSATLHIGNASLDIYPGCDTEQLKMLVELLRLGSIADDEIANAKSIVMILDLGLGAGSDVEIIADGTDEVSAVDTLASLIASGFGEELSV